jgi:hypothetical protein
MLPTKPIKLEVFDRCVGLFPAVELRKRPQSDPDDIM